MYINIETKWVKLEDDAAEYEIQVLNGVQYLNVWQHQQSKSQMMSGPGVIQALQYAVKGWKNVKDSRGNEIPFRARDIANLDANTILLLFNEVMSYVNETHEKANANNI